jgi:D-serine deaminase-like pyridoxal phosphate-dependent protein
MTVHKSCFTHERYEAWRAVFRGRRLPLAFVDLDAFDANIAYVARQVEGSGKTVRIGTKSVRCEPLMVRIFQLGGPCFRGFLTFTAEETAWLAQKGHDDFLLAYPTVQPNDLRILADLTRAGKTVRTMVDCPEHLEALSRAGKEAGVVISACLEVDLAYRPLGLPIHLGLRRSPIRTPEQALALVEFARRLEGVRIDSLMGYEGHIAGIQDALPGAVLKNWLLRTLKRRSVRELTRRRAAVVRALREAGVELRVVNGGGSGSLISTLRDPSVTEVTVGSGFYAPALFHHFAQVSYRPAAFFALQVVRRPAPGMVACQGGGYVASGPAGPDKAPLPVLPPGLRYLPLEGAGEVSTPLLLPRDCPELRLGDPVFFQHAKAGELCERFNELYLLRGGEIVGQVPTYRGEGGCFL